MDCSDPTYKGELAEFYESHQRKLVDASDPASVHIEGHETERVLNALGRFGLEAGSEQSTQLPLVGFKNSICARM